MPSDATVTLDRMVDLFAPVRDVEGGENPNRYREGPAKPIFVGRVAANVEVLSGRDLVYAQQIQSLATHRVIILWRGDVQANWQVKFEDLNLQIDGVPLPVGRRQRLKLMCIGKV